MTTHAHRGLKGVRRVRGRVGGVQEVHDTCACGAKQVTVYQADLSHEASGWVGGDWAKNAQKKDW